MKARFILELDLTASVEANMEFLDKCEKQIKLKRKRLKELQQNQPVSNQLDLEKESERQTSDGN